MVSGESHIDCERTKFYGRANAGTVRGLKSSMTFRRCDIRVKFYAGRIRKNGRALFEACTIQSSTLLAIEESPQGEIELKGNQLMAGMRPMVCLDAVSRKPVHDLKHVCYRETDTIVSMTAIASSETVSLSRMSRHSTLSQLQLIVLMTIT